MAWLLIDNVSRLGIASTKNNALISSKKLEIENSNNVDSLKVYAKTYLTHIRQSQEQNSLLTIRNITIIISIIILQFFLLRLPRKMDN